MLDGWEDFDTELEDWEGLGAIREPVMPGSDDEFSDFEEMPAEEEEDHQERLEVEVVQDILQGEESESVCMEGEDNTENGETVVGGDDHTDNTSDTSDEVDTTQSTPPLLPRDGATWSAPGAIQVHPFYHHPDSPLDAFLLTFTPDLIAMIVSYEHTWGSLSSWVFLTFQLSRTTGSEILCSATVRKLTASPATDFESSLATFSLWTTPPSSRVVLPVTTILERYVRS